MIKCDNCGAGMRFEPATQMLVCDYCENTTSPQSVSTGQVAAEDDVMYATTAFSCPDCGGEILGDSDEAITFCSYCGNSVELKSRVIRMKKPSMLIPFRVCIDEAIKNYRSYVKKSLFVPKRMLVDEKIERFRGIYMPYWVYDFKKRAQVKIDGTKEHRSGDYIITDKYQYTADMDCEYDGMPFDATSAFSDSLSEAISPFDLKESIDFNEAYIAGFYADAADTEASVYKNQARKMVTDSIISSLDKREKLAGITLDDDSIQFDGKDDNEEKMAYCPVWFLSHRFGDKISYAVVNGQNGKVAADLPIDIKKFLLLCTVIALPIMLLLNLFLTLRPVALVLIGIVFSVIGIILISLQANEIYMHENYFDDLGKLYKNRNEIAEKLNDPDTVSRLLSKQPVYVPMPITQSIKYLIKPWIAIIMNMALFIIDPTKDIWYYLGAAVSMGVTLLSFTDLIKQHNRLALRPLPQFNKRGGDA